MSFILCPQCRGLAIEQRTRFGVRHECCGMWSWNYKQLVSRETHEARKQAHLVFDEVWKSGKMSRSEAYKELAIALNIPRKDCHIAEFSEEQCRMVIEYSRGWMWT